MGCNANRKKLAIEQIKEKEYSGIGLVHTVSTTYLNIGFIFDSAVPLHRADFHIASVSDSTITFN